MTRERAQRMVEEAFSEVPRPSNEELLHERCYDDMDLEPLYPIAHWRDMTDEDVINAYSALSFLSPAGFRHFVPAYMSYALRNPTSPQAVVSSTVWAFAPSMYAEDLQEFTRSKWVFLDHHQRRAIAAFLEAMAPYEDVDAALAEWRAVD
jgi:hypothetical protein